MPYLELDGIRFHYELTGDGPAVVFAHGLTGELDQPRELLGRLEGYRQLFWDARAHGLTEPPGPAEKLTFASFAHDLAALMDRVKIDRAIVGGISMGAAVAIRFAIEHLERVRGLVVVRPAWLERPLPEGLRLFPRVAEYLERFDPDRGLAEFKKLAEFEAIRSVSAETAENLLSQFHRPLAFERRARLRRIPGDAPIESWEQVQHLHVPALVVGNEPDLIHPISFAVTWAERLPRGRFVQVPAKCHSFEEHTNAFRMQLNRFLKSLDDSSTT